MCDLPLEACVLCGSAEHVTVHETPSPFSDGATGVVTRCTACQLRGPWRTTERGAREAWNRHVAPDPATRTS